MYYCVGMARQESEMCDCRRPNQRACGEGKAQEGANMAFICNFALTSFASCFALGTLRRCHL